jgi:hypothetical protein
MTSAHELQLKTSFLDLHQTIENLTIDNTDLNKKYEELKIVIESKDEGVTDFTKQLEEYSISYKAKISQLQRSNSEFQQKFVIYCQELEVKLTKEHQMKEKELEMKITSLKNKIERIIEEYTFKNHVQESIAIKKIKLKKSSLKH